MKKKERADKLLSDQGLARSRNHAQALIMAGQVCVGDMLVKKSSETFDPSTCFRLKEGTGLRFVSRGGDKLQGALTHLQWDIKGLLALDVGMSTGGFTDCLLQNGVSSVTGLDVGHNQLDWKLRTDPRVKFHEGINCRQIPKDLILEPIDIAVIDVSFISLTLIIPGVMNLIKTGGFLLALIKPPFEVERGQVGKGGIVKDPLLHRQVQDKIKRLCEAQGLVDILTFSSSIEGTNGNKEFFISGRCSSHSVDPSRM